MLKVAIVEDELFMREFLENCVDYAEFNLEICGSFCCARDALDTLRGINPELIITDVKMPGMNGIEFMSEMLKINEDTHFVVVSNYMDFETVKAAFQIGICDYIPKIKFNLEDYKKILKDFVTQTKAQAQSEVENLYQAKEKLRKSFYDSYPKNNVDEEKYSIALLEILNYNDIINSQWGMDKELLKYGISNYLDELLTGSSAGDFFFDTYERIVLLFSESGKESIIQLLEAVREFLQRTFLIRSCIFLDKSYVPFSDLKIKLMKFEPLKGIRFFLPEKCVISKAAMNDFIDSFDYITTFTEIEKNFYEKEFETVSQRLYQITKLKPSPEIAESLMFFYRNIFSLFADFARKENIQFMDADKIKTYLNASNCNEVYEYLNEKLKQFSEYLISADNKLEQQIDGFLQNHYMEDITLKQIAQHFGYEYTYFSKIFRSIKGVAFKKYLNNIRLDEAKKLISETNLKYHTIALRVGYQNYEHFNRCFRKKYGCRPNEIKRVDENDE